MTRLSCIICAGKPSNRMKCAHETVVAKCVTINSANNIVDTQSDHLVLPADETIEESLTDGRITRVSYVSKLSRHVFACIGEESALKSIIRISSGNSDVVTAIDNEARCSICRKDVKVGGNFSQTIRSTVLHTLHHGSIPFRVIDIVCMDCGITIPYDGVSHGVFRVNQNHLFARELLDMWLWDICGTGGTFRHAYSSWSSKSYAATASLHRIGTDNFASRQLSNEAFTCFLKTLTFSKEENLFELFSCTDCEKRDSDGNYYLDGIVMDGTALGILGTLPNFVRHSEVVHSVPRIPDRQYLIRDPKIRSFIDKVLVAARSSNEDGIFSVSLKLALWRKRESLIERLFSFSAGENDEAYLAACVFSTCLRIGNSGSQFEVDNANSDDELNENPGKIVVTFILRDIDVRRTLVEFGRCFLSGSIAGGSLRKTQSINVAADLSKEFTSFAECVHEVGNVCQDCRTKLLSAGYSSEELLPAGGRLAVAISTAGSGNESLILRCLARFVSLVLLKCIEIRKRYYNLFEQNQTEGARIYNETHRFGIGLPESEHLSWLKEAQTTGEFFPGREQVRPGVYFGNSSRKENARSCKKNYSKSDSHSPGIFTVQCVCSNPKLLGVSVMRECERVSTALSVLLSRFKKLPRVCYYDNACNMSRSITLRFPWVFDESMVVCDRFHYHGHTCNSVCDPDNYLSCAQHSTSGAESMNHLWNFSKSHLRFLRPDNLMPFLALRAIFLNVRASIRKEKRHFYERVQSICPK